MNHLENATKLHAEQKYNLYSYSLHLQGVVAVYEKYGYLLRDITETPHFVMLACCYHDVLEDCNINYSDLSKLIPEEAANIVYAVTNELGKNRAERNAKTYPKIKASKEALFVKLCDRIANVRFGVYTNSTMLKLYRKEHEEFYNSLYNGLYTEMWEELRNLLRE